MTAAGRLFAAAARSRRDISFADVLARERLPRWETEYQFDAVRRWRFDFAWPLFRIAVEQEGGAHGRLIVVVQGFERRGGANVAIKPGTRIRVGGRHQSGTGLEGDAEKYNAAAIAGWLVIRGSTRQIRDGETLRDLRAAFAARGLE